MFSLKNKIEIKSLEHAINSLFMLFQKVYPQAQSDDIERLKSKLTLNSLFMPSHTKDIRQIVKNGFELEHSELASVQRKLLEIDEFFLNTAKDEQNEVVKSFFNKKLAYRDWIDSTFFNYFMIVQTMLKPVQLIKLKSLSNFDYFVNANSKTLFDFLTCLDTAVFSVEEAEECYQAILNFPRKGIAYDTKNNKIAVHCALSAQYWFVGLMTKKAEGNKALYQWQLQKLREAPHWLLDFSDTYQNPMSWLIKLSLEDDEKTNILQTKGNLLLKEHIAKEIDVFQHKQCRLNKLLVKNETFPEFDVSNFPKEQHNLVIALKKLEDILQKYQPNLARACHKGNSPEKISRFEELLGGLNIAEDIKVLYRWFNGSDFSMLFDFPGFDALEDTFLNQNAHESEAWLVLTNDESSLISPLSESKQNQSPLYVRDMWQRELYLEHESVLAMVQCFTESYQKLVIQDDDDWVTCDEDRFDQIRLKYSPKASVFDNDQQKRTGQFYDLDDQSTWLPEWQKFSR